MHLWKLTTSLLLLALSCDWNACNGEDTSFLIMHNNDMHARFEETSRNSGTCKSKKREQCVGGFARVAHVVRNARAAAEVGVGPKILYLNAGDTYTGTAWYAVHKWRIVVDFLNKLMPDAMSFGNHEFDNAIEGLLPLLDGIKFPIVAANLDYSKEPQLAERHVPKSVVLNVNGQKVGVIGYITGDTVQISQPGSLIFLNEVEAIKEESERLDRDGVKMIIALGHSGFDMDKEIAKKVPLVDVVIGGHTNTFLWNGPAPDIENPEGLYPTVIQQNSGKKVPVVQAYAYTKYMGRLNVTFDENGDLTFFEGQPLLLDHTIHQDEDMLELLEKYRPEVSALDTEVLGKTRVVLDGSSQECRFRECNFGNWIADALVDYRTSVYGGVYWTDAPIGLINGGTIRNSINATMNGGNVTRAELLGCMPFDNQIYTVSLNGSDLVETLEIGLRANGTSRGEFLQMSGLKVVYDLSKPIGHRVLEVKVRCGQCFVPKYSPIDLRKTYRIVTTSFLIAGGDGHHVLRDRGFKKRMEDLNDLEILVWYMRRHNPIFPSVEDRITILGENNGNALSSAVPSKMSHHVKLTTLSLLLLSSYNTLKN